MVDAIEYNEANIIGVRPAVNQDSIRVYNKIPDTATEFTLNTSVDNATSTIYTVPASTTLYLCNFHVHARNLTAAFVNCYLILYDSVGAVKYNLVVNVIQTNDAKSIISNFYTPLSCVAGDYFVGRSYAVNMTLFISLHGYLI